jgi:hypothetical protein
MNFHDPFTLTFLKGTTALVSWLTAEVTWHVIPPALALPFYAISLEREVATSTHEAKTAKKQTEEVAKSKSEFEAFMATVCHEIRVCSQSICLAEWQ